MSRHPQRVLQSLTFVNIFLNDLEINIKLPLTQLTDNAKTTSTQKNVMSHTEQSGSFGAVQTKCLLIKPKAKPECGKLEEVVARDLEMIYGKEGL